MTTRSVLLPTGEPPSGANRYVLQAGIYSDPVLLGPSGLTRFYMHGPASFLLTATAAGALDTPLGFSFLQHVDPTVALVEPPALPAWVSPRAVAINALNAPSEAGTALRMLSDESWFGAQSTGVAGYAVPPGFADTLEARLGTGGGGAPMQTIIRCGPETDHMDLDSGEMLPVPAATKSDDGTTMTFTFEVPPEGSRGDVVLQWRRDACHTGHPDPAE